MSCNVGEIWPPATTDALFDAEVERFLKRGILDNMLAVGCDDDEDAEDTEVVEDVLDEADSRDVSDPDRDNIGCSSPFISPKN